MNKRILPNTLRHSLLALIFLAGCASGGGKLLAPVGPANLSGGAPCGGYLLVYSATEEHNDGGPMYYPHILPDLLTEWPLFKGRSQSHQSFGRTAGTRPIAVGAVHGPRDVRSRWPGDCSNHHRKRANNRCKSGRQPPRRLTAARIVFRRIARCCEIDVVRCPPRCIFALRGSSPTLGMHLVRDEPPRRGHPQGGLHSLRM